MILAWMLFATAIATLLGAAALAAEKAAGACRLPRRLPWAAAIVLSLAWPALALVRIVTHAGVAPSGTALPALVVTAAVEQASTLVTQRSIALVGRADRFLLVVWIALTLVLLVRLGLRFRALARQRASWRAATVDGVAVRLAPDAGPAVVGFRAMDIVLPDWILSLDTPLRALILRHEEEHRRARDPILVLLAAVAVTLMPWNPALWWQARRVRLALEMDCDARVLAAHRTPERYGLLLLTIAQRRSAASPSLAPALSEPASNLERRIVAMRSLARRISIAKTAAALGVACTAIVIACAVTAPTDVAGPLTSRPRAAAPNQPYFEFQVEKQARPLPGSPAPRYPDDLREANVEGQVLVQFVLGADGRPEMGTFKVLKSTHAEFTDAVRGSLTNMRFAPAEVGGRSVRQLVQMPFVFSLAHQ